MSDRDPSNVWTTAPVPTLSESMDIARHLEKQRIIKLLNKKFDDYTKDVQPGQEFSDWHMGIRDAITIIETGQDPWNN